MYSSTISSSSLTATWSLSPSSMGCNAFCCGQQQLFFVPTRASSSPKAAASVRPPFPSIEAKAVTSRENRISRHERIRKKVEGTPERPRMSVFRSNKHIYVQVIDDSKMHTLASASTMQRFVSEELDYSSGPTIEVAKKVGKVIAKSCLKKGITKVAFDRGGYPYHGRIEALAGAARENGLQF